MADLSDFLVVVASYSISPLSSHDAAEAARAWNELADGTLSADMVRRLEELLRHSGEDDFVAFRADRDGELCGLATARVTPHPLSGKQGEIDALMIDERLPDEAGDELARHTIEWLQTHGAQTISHLRDPASPAAFWERLGFRPDLLRYVLAE